MTALEDAYMELRRRRSALDLLIEADETGRPVGLWRERSVVAALEDVADYVKRIGDHGDSSYYRGDKSRPLLHGAIATVVACFQAMAPEASEEELYELGKDLQAAADAMIEKMWAIAQR